MVSDKNTLFTSTVDQKQDLSTAQPSDSTNPEHDMSGEK